MPELKNQIGMSDELIKLLIIDFRKLEAIDVELPQKIVKFVVDGEEPDFPTVFAAILANCSYNGSKYYFSYKTPHGNFFRKYDLNHAAPLFRLAQIYGAMAS